MISKFLSLSFKHHRKRHRRRRSPERTQHDHLTHMYFGVQIASHRVCVHTYIYYIIYEHFLKSMQCIDLGEGNKILSKSKYTHTYVYIFIPI